MQYHKKVALLFWLSWSIFSPTVSFADDGDEIIQELARDCRSFAKEMARMDKKFPNSENIKNIEGLVTWRAALCGEPPKGEGFVTNLCDGHLSSGGSIFFWQKKTRSGKLENGFVTCE